MVIYGYYVKHLSNQWYMDKHGRWVDSLSNAEVFDDMRKAQDVAHDMNGKACRL